MGVKRKGREKGGYPVVFTWRRDFGRIAGTFLVRGEKMDKQLFQAVITKIGKKATEIKIFLNPQHTVSMPGEVQTRGLPDNAQVGDLITVELKISGRVVS